MGRNQFQLRRYSSILRSGLVTGAVRKAVRRVGMKPPPILSISFCVSWRAPIRVSTRLLFSCDIDLLPLQILVPSPNIPGRNQTRELGVKAHVRIAYRTCRNVAGMRKGSVASHDLFDFFFCELASPYAAQYPVFVVIRHKVSPFLSCDFFSTWWAQVDEIKICRSRKMTKRIASNQVLL